MNVQLVLEAARRIQAAQSSAELRKESGTSLITVLTIIATVATLLLDVVPQEWTIVAAILAAVAAGVNLYVSRFTVPALTDGQRDKLAREAAEVEIEKELSTPAPLPVYDGPTSEEG